MVNKEHKQWTYTDPKYIWKAASEKKKTFLHLKMQKV